MISGRYGILPTHAGWTGQMYTVAHHPHVRGRYRNLDQAKELANRQRAMVYDLVDNKVVFTSDGAEEAFRSGRAGPVGRAMNKGGDLVDKAEATTHGRGTGYRAPRAAW